MYAPIIVFAFNRLEPLKRCVESLSMNSEAIESDLIVYVDGPRTTKEGEAEKVAAVKKYVKSITGFKSLTYHFSEMNKKLGPSIIAGVTDVINQYGRAIVIEDDLIVSRNLLAYMNQGLDRYEHEKEVISICGYTNKVRRPKDYPFDAYFCSRSASWGWATWKDRWDTVDWDLKDWAQVEKNGKAFNKWGGSDMFGILQTWRNGKNQSWAVRFCYSQFVQDKVALFPMKSLIDNEGFDGEGTNCKKWSRFKFEMDETVKKEFLFPTEIMRNKQLYYDALKYHSIWIRLYSRIMYMWYDLKG